MTDQRSAWLRLRELSCNPPSPISRSEVLEALKSKSDSIRSEAAEALAKWGDAESMHSLREFLEGALVPRDFAWVDRDIAIRALVRCVGDTDAGWLLDLYFLPTTVDYRRDFFPLLLRLSNPSVRDRLLAECRSEDPVHRRDAIRAVTALHLSEEAELLEQLSQDPERTVADLAVQLLSRFRLLNHRSDTDPLVRCIAAKFQPALRNAHSATEDGTLPRHFYLRELSHKYGDLLQCWVMTAESVKAIHPSSWRAIRHGAVRGICYESGRIDFWVSRNGSELFLDWTIGPDDGRGWTFKLESKSAKISLGKPVLRWLS